MKNQMALGVSGKVFAQRFEAKVSDDSFFRSFQQGELRGKLNGNQFYFYESGNAPQAFTTILKGEFDDKEISYTFTKHNYTRVFAVVSTLMWSALSIILFLMQGPIGLAGFVALPFIFVPFFTRKKEELKRMERQLKRFCIPDSPSIPE